MGLIFNSDEEAFEKSIGSKFVRIGWQQQVEESLNEFGVKDTMNYGYIAGYKDSADALLELALKNGFIEAQIFPIVFLYRQYLELLFKNILAKMPPTDAYTGQPHDLEKIWKHISKVFKREKIIANESLDFIEVVVQEFHEVDPKSSNFRYFFKYGNRLTLNGKMVIDTELMKKAIDKVDTMLYATYATV